MFWHRWHTSEDGQSVTPELYTIPTAAVKCRIASASLPGGTPPKRANPTLHLRFDRLHSVGRWPNNSGERLIAQVSKLTY